jgi:hypothetical protein
MVPEEDEVQKAAILMGDSVNISPANRGLQIVGSN